MKLITILFMTTIPYTLYCSFVHFAHQKRISYSLERHYSFLNLLCAQWMLLGKDIIILLKYDRYHPTNLISNKVPFATIVFTENIVQVLDLSRNVIL